TYDWVIFPPCVHILFDAICIPIYKSATLAFVRHGNTIQTKNFILFTLFFSINIFSQKKITIASSAKIPIIDALLIIDNTPRYISDSIGNVEIKFEDLKPSISIRHLNFKPKTFENWINQDTLFLEEKFEELQSIEIIASNKTKKKIETLFPKSSARNILPENFGKSGSLNNNIELALFFPNEKYKGKVIKKVHVHTNDYKVIEDLKNKKSTKRKGAKNSPLKVNFYSVDSIY
ncbi:MAG: hypothetical protein NWP90_06555, partial [Flavobacterium sp.]|nr:hypothetical protein [Flavobacterium sp.]